MAVSFSLQQCMQCSVSRSGGFSWDTASRHTWSARLCFLLDFFAYGILVMRTNRAQGVSNVRKIRVTESYVVNQTVYGHKK
jgi:hypothetical protein